MNLVSNNKITLSLKKELLFPIIVCIAIIAGTFNGLFSYVAFALSIIALIALNEDDVIGFMMMIMPFANIFKASPGAQSFFTYLILFYLLCFFVKRNQISKTFFIALMLLIMYLLLQMYISQNILRMIKFVANILLIYLAMSCSNKNNAKKMYMFYVFGVMASSLIAALNIIPNLHNYIGSQGMTLQEEQIVRFAGMYGDPNYYSVNLIIALCLIIILNHKKHLSNIPALCLGGLSVVFVGMTLSKSSFLMLVLPLALLMYSKLKKRNYFVFFGVLILCILAIELLFSGKITIFNNVLLRITSSSDINSLTTGRSDIWSAYCKYIWNNPKILFFGAGFGAGLVNGYAAHNTYIDLIYYLGIAGTILVLLVFGALIKNRRNTVKVNLLNYSVWICIGLMYFFLSELFYFDWAFHIIIAICIFKTDMNKTKDGV